MLKISKAKVPPELHEFCFALAELLAADFLKNKKIILDNKKAHCLRSKLPKKYRV